MIACMKTHNEQHCLQLIMMHDLCGEADGRQFSQQEQSDLEDSRYVGTSHGTSGVSTAIDL